MANVMNSLSLRADMNIQHFHTAGALVHRVIDLIVTTAHTVSPIPQLSCCGSEALSMFNEQTCAISRNLVKGGREQRKSWRRVGRDCTDAWRFGSRELKPSDTYRCIDRQRAVQHRQLVRALLRPSMRPLILGQDGVVDFFDLVIIQYE